MEIVKTPSSRFSQIKDFPYQEHFIDFGELQMHYIDEGSGETILALHGEPTWCYLYRKFIPALKDFRFIAPDLIGFGKSDKIVKRKDYTFELHFSSLENFIDKLDLSNITLVVQDWGGLLGLSLLGEYPEKFNRIIILNTYLPVGKRLNLPFKIWQAYARFHPALPIGRIVQMGCYNKLTRAVKNAYDAPFPSNKYKGGAKAFPALVPSRPSDPGVGRMIKAREVLAKWTKPALVMFSDKDPIFSGVSGFFYNRIPSAREYKEIVIRNAGHFLQEEKGEEIAAYIDEFMKGGLKVS